MADDEIKSPESQSDSQTEDQNPPGVEELGESRDRIAELEDLLAQKDEGLTKANARIIELEQAVVESEGKLVTINHSLAEAVASYKNLVTRSNSEVPEELITGDTIEAINESLERAKTLVSKVRQEIETEITAGKVPTGAPIRTPADLSALSPREKINYAIGGKV